MKTTDAVKSLFSLIVFSFTILSFLCAGSGHAQDSIFTVPPIIKNNVDFWKKIYTEIPTTEGVVHDRDYPMVIYRRIPENQERSNKAQVASMLRSMVSSPESTWTDEERQIAQMFRQYADSGALNGAAERVRFQLGQSDHYKEGLVRSGMYLDTMLSILRSCSIPDRLVYLPHVESSFNTAAYSKVGAAGLWQFMRSTGRLYGMKINYTIDERRDPVIATKAAAKYLLSSYRDLGSWPVAITSYNYGYYGMKQAVEETGSNDLNIIIQKYKSRSFKFASTNFYGCFLAASEIAMNCDTYFPSVKFAPKLVFSDVLLDHYIGTDIVCRYLGIPKALLMILNPEIRPAVFEQRKSLPQGFAIHVPATSVNQATLALASIPDSLKSNEPERPKYYRVNRGDNLWSIASRLEVPIAELLADNNLGPKNRIRAGQVLRVPQKASTVVAMATAAPSAPVKEPEPSPSLPLLSPAVPLASPTAEAIPSPGAEGSSSSQPDSSESTAELATLSAPYAAVEEGDTHSIIPAKQSEVPNVPQGAPTTEQNSQKVSKQLSRPALPVSIQQITSRQQKESTAVKPAAPQPVVSSSQAVAKPKTIPVQKAAPSQQLADSLKEVAMAPALTDQTQPAPHRAVVPPGFDVTLYDLDAVMSPTGNTAEIRATIDETIGHYADWLGVPIWKIAKLNGTGRKFNIRINQRIVIPIDHEDALEQFASARLEYHMAIEEDFYTQYKVTDVKEHIIRHGENLWDICHEADSEIPLWLFKKYNKQLDLGKLMPGTSVLFPVIGDNNEQVAAVPSIDQNDKPSHFVKPLHNSSQGLMLAP